MSFTQSKHKFDKEYENKSEIVTFLPEHLTFDKCVSLLKTNRSKNEQYYKWQFLYALINSGLYAKDYIGTEIHLPKGNKTSASLKIDAVIFDSKEWFEKYQDYHKHNNLDSLQWLKKHILVVVEFKKEHSKNIPEVYDKQLKAYMKESEKDFVLGILYDTERLYLFKKVGSKFLRYVESFNAKGEESNSKDLNLHLPDSYSYIPDFQSLQSALSSKEIDYAKRTLKDLELISGVHSTQIGTAMSEILRTMDKVSLVNQKGFLILIQILSLKIYDEKSKENSNEFLQFYITKDEQNYKELSGESLQNFIKRIKSIMDKASGNYRRILKEKELDFKNENHIKVLISIVKQFQDYSFVKSYKTDLYQLIFYRFASQFAKDSNAQFITPLPIIDFLVNIINPRNGETVIDPTVGIADFLSISYVNSNSKLDDNNIFGLDIDTQMVNLATLNMLLNGDGNAKIEQKADLGSILYKFDKENGLLELDPNTNKNGAWDTRADSKELKKFNVVLTNPPFGEDRAFVPTTDRERAIIKCYESWGFYNESKNSGKIDLGVVFLENACRILDENGRLGIVLSNSIASIDTHKKAREWLIKNMRIVAIFDLPANSFAETGVNISLIVAYKPSKAQLERLNNQGYEIFIKNIQNLGYEIKTNKRVKYFAPIYKINPQNFEIEIDNEGRAKLDEDFTQTALDFKEWCKCQEEILQKIFIAPK